MFAMSEATILYNVIPLHWKGRRETIGEDGDEIVTVKRRVGGCWGVRAFCFVYLSTHISSLMCQPTLLLASHYISIINTGTSKV